MNDNEKSELYDYLIDYSIATEDEIRLVCQIKGDRLETLEEILYARTGYEDLEQLKEEEE